MIFRMCRGFGFSLAVTVAGLLAGAAPASAQAGGKSMQLIVGMPPGGGEDAYARLVQRHLVRHLAGSPSIVVQNMPGAGSLRSVMALSHAPEDGSVIGTFSSSAILETIFAPERLKIDFRNFAFLGNVSEDVRVCYVWAATGVHTFADMQSRDSLTFGATAAGTSGNVDAAVLRKLFGIRMKQVNGYSGSAEKRLAVEKGEIDGDCGGFTSIPEAWLRNRKVNLLVRLSPTLLSGLDGAVPFGGDLLSNPDDRRVYDFLTSPERLGRLFMVSSKVPAARLAALREAFDAMLASAEFRSDAEKSRLTVTPMSGPEVDRRIAELYATPADLIARARTITAQ